MAISLISCTDEVDDPIIAEELQEYVNRFIDEAASRDLVIDVNEENLSVEVDRIADRGVVGQCINYSDGSQEVVIHSPYWNQIDEVDREYLIFHELGHCLLGRDHNDSSDNRGNCVSIMQSGDDVCDKLYNEANRNELLDELFIF